MRWIWPECREIRVWHQCDEAGKVVVVKKREEGGCVGTVGMASRVETWGGIAMDKNLLDPFCFVSPLVLGKAEERSECHPERGRKRWMGLVLMKPRDNEHGLVQLFHGHERLDSRVLLLQWPLLHTTLLLQYRCVMLPTFRVVKGGRRTWIHTAVRRTRRL